MPVATTIKRIRESAGYSQSQLARFIGIGQSTVAEYEKRKKSPSFAVFTKIVHLAYQKKIRVNLKDFIPIPVPAKKKKVKRKVLKVNAKSS